MGSPTDRRYTDTHEWIMMGTNPARTGITQYRVNELGTVASVGLPDKDQNVTTDQVIGSITGANATHDFHSPVKGHITDHHEILFDKPGSINSDPYDAGWIMEITPSNISDISSLMKADDYDAKYPLT